MSEQSFLAKLGLRLGVLGSSASLALAAPSATGTYDPACHTAANRTGVYFDMTAAAEKFALIVGGQTGPIFTRNGSVVDSAFSGTMSISGVLSLGAGLKLARVTFSNAPIVLTVANLYAAQVGVMSAARAATLPAAATAGAGALIVIADESGTVTSTNKITVTKAGSDTINGAATLDITTAYGSTMLVSDGTSKWTTVGSAGGGGGSSLTATYVGYGDGSNVLTGEAAFNYIAGTNTLTVDNVAGITYTLSGQLTSTLATGTPPFVVASTTVVGNLNASLLLGGTWAIPGTLGSTTPNTASVTTLTTSGITTLGSGLKLSRTTFSNAATVLTTASLYVAQTGSMSAARTATLPAASTAGAGAVYYIADESGTVTSTNKITVTRAGSDTINGGTTLSLTTAYGNTLLVSDGTSKWTAIGGNSSTALTSTYIGVGDSSNFLSGTTSLTFDATNATLNLVGKESYGTAVTALGDSIMLGTGIGAAGSRIPNLTAAAHGWALTNDAISGSQLVGQIAAATTGIYSLVTTTGQNYMILTGYNDMRYSGSSATAQLAYQQALYAALTWLAIPDSKKIYGQNALVVQAGSGWTNSASYSGTLGVKSSTNGDTLTVSLRGSTILLGIGHKNGGTGQFSVTIDGGGATVYSCGGNWANNAMTTGPEVVVITGLTNALHTVVLTVGGADVSQLDWCIGLGQDIVTWNVPRVYVGNCLRMNATGYTLGAPFNNGSNAVVISLNTIIAAVIANLQSIGLQVFAVPASQVYNPDDGDVQADNIHPNTTGAARIANMFIQQMAASNINYGGGASGIVGTANQIIVTQGVGTTTLSLAAAITITGGTVTASAPVLNLTQTWNAGGVTFAGVLLNITNTASAAASKLFDLQVAAASKFNVDPTGLASAITLQAFGLAGSSSLTVTGGTQTANFPAITSTQTWNAGGVTFQGWLLNVTDTASSATSRLLDLQISATSKFIVDKAGLATAVSLATAGIVGTSALSLAGGTQTTNIPALSSTITWNSGGTTFDAAWLLNVTDTASAATSKLLDLQVAAASKFNVDKAGLATAISLQATGVAGTSGLAVAGGTQTTNIPFISVTGTWNSGGTTFDAALLVNVTDTASASTSKLLDLQVAAASKFNVNKAGLCTTLTLNASATTDSTTTATGAITSVGGLGVAKAGFFGGSINVNGAIAAATQPAILAAGTSTIVGGVTDAYTASIRHTPTYSAGSALTITRHNYMDLNNPVLTGAGPAALTDAAVFRFDAAAGTHKATKAATTKITVGGVDAWVIINMNGTLMYMPAYLSTTT